jgi:transcriptional antiterminator RfaH
MAWGVVYAQAQCERVAGRNLERQGYEVFLPECQTRKGVRPLFPRYLFVLLDLYRWWPITGTRGVSGLLMNGERPGAVEDEVIEELKRRRGDEGLVRLERFGVGDRVRVDEGPFSGLEGLVTGNSRRRVEVLLSIMNRKVKLSGLGEDQLSFVG